MAAAAAAAACTSSPLVAAQAAGHGHRNNNNNKAKANNVPLCRYWLQQRCTRPHCPFAHPPSRFCGRLQVPVVSHKPSSSRDIQKEEDSPAPAPGGPLLCNPAEAAPTPALPSSSTASTTIINMYTDDAATSSISEEQHENQMLLATFPLQQAAFKGMVLRIERELRWLLSHGERGAASDCKTNTKAKRHTNRKKLETYIHVHLLISLYTKREIISKVGNGEFLGRQTDWPTLMRS